MNFIIGFFPAVILGFVFCYLAMSERAQLAQHANVQYWMPRSIIIYGLIAVAFFQFNYIYGSVLTGTRLFYQSTKYTEAGPFAGLYIEPFWYNHLLSLQRDIHKLDTDDNKYIYFGPLAAGYLLIDHLKPGESILFCPYYVNHFGLAIKRPSYIVFDPVFADISKGDSRESFMPAELLNKSIVSNSNYEIYDYHKVYSQTASTFNSD